MLTDALRSFRRSLAPTSRLISRRFRSRRPVASAERLEDRTLLSAVNHFQTFHGVDWTSVGAGGISHNLDSEGWTPPEGGWGQATLSVDDVQGTVTHAYLYWHGVGTERSGDVVGDADDAFNEPNTYDNETIVFDGQTIVGVSLGRGPAPDHVGIYRGESQSFRADVTELVRAGLSGSTEGAASFRVANLSAKRGHSADGVSLVIVYDDGDSTNDRDVYLLDGNAVSDSSASRWITHLPDFLYRRGDVRAQLHVADGQWIPTAAPADPPLTFQTRLGANYPVRIADTDTLFDGLVPPADRGWFGGNRWDVHTFDISAAFTNLAAGPGEHYLSMYQSWGADYQDSLALVALIYDTAAADPNDPPPIADDLAVSVKLGSHVDGTLPAIDPAGDRLTFEMVPGSGPSYGSAYVGRNGYFSYKSNGDYVGTDSFRYRVFDGNNWSEATVYLTVRENTPPVLSDQSFSGLEDLPISARVIGRDDDGDTLQFSLVPSAGSPAFGTVELNSDGTFLYTPDANFHGTDSFLVKASDGEYESAVVTVTVTVAAVNDAPTLIGRKLVTAEDVSLTFLMGGTDLDGDSLSYAVAVAPGRGTLTRNANGSYTYLPAANYAGGDSFSVSAFDGEAYSEVATFTVEVTPVNDPPTVPPQSDFATDEDTPLVGRVEGVDIDGDTLMYVLEQLPKHGTLLFDETTGEFTYTPGPNYHGSDSFRYVAKDGQSTSGTGTVAIRVAAVNDAPTFDGASLTILDNSPAGTGVGIVAGIDIDGDDLTYAITGGNELGYFAIDRLSGAITLARSGLDYRSTPEFQLTVIVSDSRGGTTEAVVVVTVQPLTVGIDVKPGDNGNQLDTRVDKLLPVAILSTASFDATQIEVASLTFGDSGDEASLSVHPKKGPRFEYRDVNGDGLLDLVAYFDLTLTGLGEGDTTATLKGRFSDGTDFVGTDSVSISSSNGKGGPRKK